MNCVINNQCANMEHVLASVRLKRNLAYVAYLNFFNSEFPAHKRLCSLMIASCVVMLASVGLMVPMMHYVGGETAMAKIIAGSLGSLMLLGGFGFGLTTYLIDKNKEAASNRFAAAHPTKNALLHI